MDVRELANKVKEQIRNYIPKEYGDLDIQARSVWKNNVEKTGITIRKEGETIAPAFWIDEMEGSLEEICQGIARAYISQREEFRSMDESARQGSSFLTDYRQVKPQLRCRVVGIRNNEEMLKETVHKKVLNLAVVPYILFEDLNGIANVTRGFTEIWGVSARQVMKDAMKNMDRKEAMLVSMSDEFPFERIEIYTLLSKQGQYGSFWMLDREKLREIGNDLGDFTILPSSIYETMILPDAELSKMKIEGFEEMEEAVREMNETEIPPEDRLSDTVYHYDARRQILSVPLHEMEIPAKELPMAGRETMKKERRGR